ncbi:MAG: DegV family protein [Eubacteriales bacterium]|nr:DegV family protein [Eubacteriales bacterium]MDD3881223.1 DegV family protein [Eubacteriales bacterium]MDD4512141.1 DegV family protein [Eubacteriales bacterium]
MNSFHIVADSCADLTPEYLSAVTDMTYIRMNYTLDGADNKAPLEPAEIAKLYAELRSGKVITTTQINMIEYFGIFEPFAKAGTPVLCLVFSSGLSGTFGAAVVARNMIMEKYPSAEIYVVDSLSASRGEGLLLHYIIQKRAEGMTAKDAAKWAEDNRKHLIHWFTVDDLMFLKRGGRVSATSAFLGTMIKIKPVLKVDDEGHLIPVEKVQGRRRAMHSIADRIKESGIDLENQTLFLGHGDCLEEAELLKERLLSVTGCKGVEIGYIGPIIGAHSGPGTLAVFCLGGNR